MALNTTTTIYGSTDYPSRRDKFDVKSKEENIFGFNYPITPDSTGGYFSKARGVELVKNGLRQLLLTEPGERVMLPLYGTSLRKYLMEPLDETLLNKVKIEIVQSISKYAKDVKIQKLQIFPSEARASFGGHFLSIRLFCKLNNPSNTNFDVSIEIG
jgi:phage baseplate assembly protein W